MLYFLYVSVSPEEWEGRSEGGEHHHEYSLPTSPPSLPLYTLHTLIPWSVRITLQLHQVTLFLLRPFTKVRRVNLPAHVMLANVFYPRPRLWIHTPEARSKAWCFASLCGNQVDLLVDGSNTGSLVWFSGAANVGTFQELSISWWTLLTQLFQSSKLIMDIATYRLNQPRG